MKRFRKRSDLKFCAPFNIVREGRKSFILRKAGENLQASDRVAPLSDVALQTKQQKIRWRYEISRTPKRP